MVPSALMHARLERGLNMSDAVHSIPSNGSPGRLIPPFVIHISIIDFVLFAFVETRFNADDVEVEEYTLGNSSREVQGFRSIEVLDGVMRGTEA